MKAQVDISQVVSVEHLENIREPYFKKYLKISLKIHMALRMELWHCVPNILKSPVALSLVIVDKGS